MIKLLRIDHRLLHGQVAFSWSQSLDANAILLANDDLVHDTLRQNVIKFSKPAGVKVIAKTIEDSIKAIRSGVTDKYNLFIIVESITDCEKIVNALDIKEVNLGGTYPHEDYDKLAVAVYANEDDKKILRNMISKGVDVYIQGVPSSNKIDVKDVI